MKLNRAKILEIIRRKNEGWGSNRVRKLVGVTKRRVDQIWRHYLAHAVPPEVGLRIGRPTKFIPPEQRTIVAKVHAKYRLSAAILEPLIEQEEGIHIPHNRIHTILLQAGLAKPTGKDVVRKKDWIRYERRYSLSAVHMDWHQRPNDGPWVLKVLDDASRAILSMLETDSPTAEASIEGLKEAMKFGKIREVITDHGSQFTNNNGGESSFRSFLDENGIKHILCRIKHPQSNGKVERAFGTYERNRDAFASAAEYLHWYNRVRPHMSLNFDELETPWQAFERKMRRN